MEQSNKDWKDNALDKWWSYDPNSYIEYWEPDMEGEVMLAKLFKKDPSLFTLVSNQENLEELSEMSGIPLKEILKRDILNKPVYLLCSNSLCKAIIGYSQTLENRTCPVCKLGTLTKIGNKQLTKELYGTP